jgi:NhaP-type Na+/H+ or K+/H+ antiporter
MPEIIVILLLVLWFVCLATSHTLGGLIHVLAVVAAGMVLVRLIWGRGQPLEARRLSVVTDPARRRRP